MASTGYSAATQSVTASECVLDLSDSPGRNYPVWVSGVGYPGLIRAATHQVLPGGFFGRGFSRFSPGDVNDGGRGEHYCGVGQIYGFNTVGDSSRMVTGMMVRFGTTFFDDQALKARPNGDIKLIILIKDNGQRPMIITKGGSGVTRVLGACNGTSCNTTDNINVLDGHNDGNYLPNINAYLGQWLWVEFAVNTTVPFIRVRTWSADGTLNGMQTIAPFGPGGNVTYQDIIGFVSGIVTPGAQPYYDLERVEYRVGTDVDMTPPAGFPGSRRNRLAVTEELPGWESPNDTSLRSPDGEIEIGDVTQTTFFPQFKDKAHRNQCNFSLRLVLPDYTPDDLSVVGNEVRFSKGAIQCRFKYETGLPQRVTIGGTDYDYVAQDRFGFSLVLASDPGVDYFDFSVRSLNIAMHLQPPLTAGEIVTGSKRADHVVNSIVLKNTAGLKDSHGSEKVGHLYRPRITDRNAVGAWCDWSIVDATTIRLNLPAGYRQTATYPAVIE